MKICAECKIEKPKTSFNGHRATKDRLRAKCKQCISDACKAYREANKERVTAYNKSYKESNKGLIRAASADYYERNKERILESCKSYRKENQGIVRVSRKKRHEENKERENNYSRMYAAANPEKTAARQGNRRAMKRAAGGKHTAADVKYLFDAQRGLCANCKTRLFRAGKQKFHVDHIQPLSRGGSNDKYNLQCLCPSCNLQKHAKTPEDWAKENWRLI